MWHKPWVKWLLVVLACGLIGTVAWPAQHWMQSTVHTQRVIHNSRLQPIIFIPGSSATQERFNSVIATLNKQTTGHSLLKVTVHPDGSLSESGAIAPHDDEPYIVVAFTDNRDGYTHIKQQAKWFNIAFKQLAATYHFNQFRGIGHSNGGLIFTLFLEKYLTADDATMTRLMTIGTPYNLEESNPLNRTQLLHDLVKGRTKLPKQLTVYAVAGTETYAGDGTVQLTSASAGKYIFQNQVRHYTQITVSGQDAGHSDLPENQQIIDYIKQDILTRPARQSLRHT